MIIMFVEILVFIFIITCLKGHIIIKHCMLIYIYTCIIIKHMYVYKLKMCSVILYRVGNFTYCLCNFNSMCKRVYSPQEPLKSWVLPCFPISNDKSLNDASKHVMLFSFKYLVLFLYVSNLCCYWYEHALELTLSKQKQPFLPLDLFQRLVLIFTSQSFPKIFLNFSFSTFSKVSPSSWTF